MEREKYRIDSLKRIPEKSRLLHVGIMIANELYGIRTALAGKKSKRKK